MSRFTLPRTEARCFQDLPQDSETLDNHRLGMNSWAKPREDPLKWVRGATGFNRFSAGNFSSRRCRENSGELLETSALLFILKLQTFEARSEAGNLPAFGFSKFGAKIKGE